MLFNYFALNYLAATLILLLLSVYLLTLKQKTRATRLLTAYFITQIPLPAGFLLYNSFFGNDLLFLSPCIINLCIVSALIFLFFVYEFPENIHPRESKIAITLFSIAATAGYLHFIVTWMGGEKYFNFSTHLMRSFSEYQAQAVYSRVFITLTLWNMILLIRKVIAMYAIETGKPLTGENGPRVRGFYVFLHALSRFFRARSPQARVVRAFAVAFFVSFIITSLFNAWAAGLIKWETYQLLFTNGLIIMYFVYAIIYLNRAPQPVTIMVKLVGICMVIIIPILTHTAWINFHAREQLYNISRLRNLEIARSSISRNDFNRIRGRVEYIARMEKKPATSEYSYAILMRMHDSITPESLAAGDRNRRKIELHLRSSGKKMDEPLNGSDAMIPLLKPRNRNKDPMKKPGYRYTDADTPDTYNVYYRITAGEITYEVGFPYRDYRAFVHLSTIKYIKIICATTALILIIFPMFFMISLIKPLKILLNGVKDIDGSDFNTILPVISNDEIGLLTKSFNKMAGSLKKTSLSLQENMHRYRELVQNANSIIIRLDPEGHITFFNEFAESFFGYESKYIEGKHVVGTIIPEYDSEGKDMKQLFQNIHLNIEQFPINENENIKSNGERVWIAWTNRPVRDNMNKVTGILCIGTDITGRKKIEESLRESEEKYRTLVEGASEVIIVAQDNKLKFANSKFFELTGYSEDEIENRYFTDLIHPDDREMVAKYYLERIKGEKPISTYPFRAIDTHGNTRWAEINAVMITWDQKPATLNFITDITDRKEAEDRYRTIFEKTGTAMVILDDNDTLVLVNAKFENLIGLPRSEIEGIRKWTEFISGDDLDAMIDLHKERIKNPQTTARNYEFSLVDSGNNVKHVYLTIDLLPGTGNFIASLVDISERVIIQKELTMALNSAEKAARVKSQFLANMSHEIRTPINGILGMTTLALTTELTDEQREYLDMVQRSSESLLKIVNDILDFSKLEAGKEKLESVEFSIRGALQQVINTLRMAADKNQNTIVTDISGDVPEILTGDWRRMQQVLINILDNAVKFTKKGEISIQVSRIATSETVRYCAKDTVPVTLEFSITDTGTGIAPEKQEIIFESFSQADSSLARFFGGTGLGLAISKELVELMGGSISLESMPGQGSTFTFTIVLCQPRDMKGKSHLESPAEISDKMETDPGADPGKLEILVVEDNLINQKLLVRLIEKNNWNHTTADNGLDALEKIEQNKFDIVLMDIQMPKMDGMEAMKKIRKNPQWADLPVIAITAYAIKGDREIFLNAGFNDYIAKPVDRDILYSKIGKLARSGKL